MKQSTDNANQVSQNTRRAILESLKTDGPREPSALASMLNITAAAVRQHLYTLMADGLVANQAQPRPVGRPVKMWHATPAADTYFPDAHAELTVSLLGSIQEAFGENSLSRLLDVRKRHLLENYRKQIPASASLHERAKRLAILRTREGYMSSVFDNGDGTLLLVENHCPICAAAAACQGLCAIEQDVFGEVLGPHVRLTRVEHIQIGARRCAYLIEPKRRGRE